MSRDVVFDELKEFNWDEKEERPTQTMFDLNEQVSPEAATLEGGNEPRRSLRPRQLPQRLSDYDVVSDDAVNSEGELIHFALLSESEPVSLDEAMQEELQSIERNQTWELVNLPNQKKPIAVKWMFKVKLNADGEVNKYKARLVAKGFFFFLQRSGIDFGEVFAPIVRIQTVRLVIVFAS